MRKKNPNHAFGDSAKSISEIPFKPIAPATSFRRGMAPPQPATNGVARMAPMPRAALSTPKTQVSTAKTSSEKTTTNWNSGLSAKLRPATTARQVRMPGDPRT